MSQATASEKRKPGNTTWAIGSRTPFFESQEGEWRAHVQTKKTGDFYSYIMKMYQVKYDGIASDADLKNPTPDMLTKTQIKAWKVACKEEEKDLSPDTLVEKQANDSAIYNNLRTVCMTCWLYNLGLIRDCRGLFRGIIGALMVFDWVHTRASPRALKRPSSKGQSHTVEDSLTSTLTCFTSHR